MENQKKNFIKVLNVIDIAVFIVTVSVFAFCICFAAVSMILGKESPIDGYGAYTAYNMLQRVGILIIVLIPFVLRLFRVVLPSPVTIAFNLFMLITVFGGTFMGLYINTNWWDKFNHTLSGVLLGLGGMFFLNALTRNNEKVSAFGIFLYAFAFAVMCGAVWEIYEFACDGLLGSNMQKFRNDHSLVEYVGREALIDTMMDIVVDACGAVVAGILCAVATSKNRDFLRMFEIKILPKKAVVAGDITTVADGDVACEIAATEIEESNADASDIVVGDTDAGDRSESLQ